MKCLESVIIFHPQVMLQGRHVDVREKIVIRLAFGRGYQFHLLQPLVMWEFVVEVQPYREQEERLDLEVVKSQDWVEQKQAE